MHRNSNNNNNNRSSSRITADVNNSTWTALSVCQSLVSGRWRDLDQWRARGFWNGHFETWIGREKIKTKLWVDASCRVEIRVGRGKGSMLPVFVAYPMPAWGDGGDASAVVVVWRVATRAQRLSASIVFKYPARYVWSRETAVPLLWYAK